MKRLIAATVALSLLGVSAASAASYGRGHNGYRGNSYSHGWNDRGYRHNNTGALVGLGIGLFALGALAANSRDRYDDRYGYNDGYYDQDYTNYGPAYRSYNRGNDGYYYGR